MIEFLKENYEWLFGGIGVTALFFSIDKFVFKSKAKSEKNDKKEIKNKNSITINNNIGKQETQTKKDKSNLRILFIDDQHTKFKMVSILKKSGWKNTNSVKDITDLDDYKAKEADIIFVDINGVGKTLCKYLLNSDTRIRNTIQCQKTKRSNSNNNSGILPTPLEGKWTQTSLEIIY